MSYEITFLSHLKQLKSIFYAFFVGTVVIFFLTKELVVPLYIRLLLPFIIIIVLSPDVVVLHFRYWMFNRNTVLTLSDECIEININGNTAEITFDDIESFELNLTRPFFDSGPVWSPGEDYLYAFIRLKSGEEFVITSLLLARLKFPESFLDKSTKIQRLRAWPK